MSDTSIRPLDDRVVIERTESEDKTAGGIYLPDTAKEKPQRGNVVAVGPGKTLDSGERAQMSVEPGDTILFAKFGGTEVEVGGRELIILRESDLLAKVED
ncbi:MAG: co-chaperone GroES [Planctomycetota bacterium]